MLIRAAGPDDLVAVGALWNAVIRDTTATFTAQEKSHSALKTMLADRKDAFLVGEARGELQGFVTWGPFRAGDGYRHTAEHSIITAHARCGTGRALMKAAQTAMLAQGIHVIVAGISGDNAGALGFHAKLGFAKVGHLPQVGRKAGRWRDLVLMSKTIGHP